MLVEGEKKYKQEVIKQEVGKDMELNSLKGIIRCVKGVKYRLEEIFKSKDLCTLTFVYLRA